LVLIRTRTRCRSMG